MAIKLLPFITVNGRGITGMNNQYHLNGVTYNVASVFELPYEENDTLTNRVFRIVDNQFAHLMQEESKYILNNEYTHLTANEKEDDLCSQ